MIRFTLFQTLLSIIRIVSSDDLQIENSFSITVSSEDCYEHAIFMAIRSFHWKHTNKLKQWLYRNYWMKWDEMYKYTLELGLGFDKISENRRNIYD